MYFWGGEQAVDIVVWSFSCHMNSWMPPCWKWLSGWGWQTWHRLTCPEQSYRIWGFAPLRKLQLFSQPSPLPTSSLVLALRELFQVQVRISGCDPGQLVAFPWSHDGNREQSYALLFGCAPQSWYGQNGELTITRESQFKWVFWRPLGLWIHVNGVWVKFVLRPADTGYELRELCWLWGMQENFPMPWQP